MNHCGANKLGYVVLPDFFMGTSINIFFSATSYPRNEKDWQGVFIKHIVNALAWEEDLELSVWLPDGARHHAIKYCCSMEDKAWLENLTQQGGIAHLLNQDKLKAIKSAATLLLKLRKTYKKHENNTDIYHINWLQNALPLIGLSKPCVVTVLGTDFKLLKLPGMKVAFRVLLKSTPCIIAPNAEWMKKPLEEYFGDLCEIIPVPFGIDDSWYKVERKPPTTPKKWIAVSRITAAKMGDLFEWGENIFKGDDNELHLFGPNQENLTIPEWVNYHGPATAEQLASKWFPEARGLISLSRHSEGRPQVMLESMASGLPIIASSLPAHCDFIAHKETGYLVSAKENFSDAISWLSNPDNNLNVSANCRNYAHKQYGTWHSCAQRYIHLYKKLKK